MALECVSLRNPNPSSFGRLPSLVRSSSSASRFSRRVDCRRRCDALVLSAASFSSVPRGLCGSRLLTLRRSVLPLAASQEDSAPLDVELEKEESGNERGTEESEEAWERALAAFKEQALRLQSVSHEAYEIYSKKALVTLQETSEKLKIEADKARYDLTILAQELGEDGKKFIAQATENSPEPLKDVVETFTTSTENVKDVSQIHDFYVGVPYGAILSLSGFLDFMITGSTSGIRFGIILGGILLALSVSSLRTWRKGEPTDGMILISETVITGILFLRQLRLFFQKLSFPGLVGTAISGAVAAFFVYRLLYRIRDSKGSNIDGEAQF